MVVLSFNPLGLTGIPTLTCDSSPRNEYSQYIAQKSSELVDACERAQRQEAEEANMRRLYLNNLQNNYTKFVSHVSQMRELYK